MNKKNKNLKTNNLTSHISLLTSHDKGITLIALIITIIVMLILTAVTVTMAVNGGLFNYASKARRETRFAMLEEQLYTSYMTEIMEDYANGTNTASFANAIAKVNLNGEYEIVPIVESGATSITLSESNIVIGTDDETKTATFTATPVGNEDVTNYYVVEGEEYFKINYTENGRVKIEREASDVNTNGLKITITDETIATGSITGNTVTITGQKKVGTTGFKVKCGSVEKNGTINAVTTRTITFNANGGTFGSNSQTATVTGIVGSTQSMPAEPTWNGHAFTGWYDATGGNSIVYTGEESTVTIPANSTEVYAHWQVDLTTATLSPETEVYFTGVPSEKFKVLFTSASNSPTVTIISKYNVNTAENEQGEDNTTYPVAFGTSSTYSGSTIEGFVNTYVSGKLGITDLVSGTESAGLLLLTDLQILNNGTTPSSGTLPATIPDFVKNTNFWLGSAYTSSYGWGVNSGSLSNYRTYYTTSICGVRPVLTVSKSRLSLVSE